jgi:hypothetical protein
MLGCLLAAVVIISLGYALWPQNGMASRNLQCDGIDNARARAICERLEQEMAWTWMGHTIVSPGWRVSLQSVTRTYCVEKIDPRDIPALEGLRHIQRLAGRRRSGIFD